MMTRMLANVAAVLQNNDDELSGGVVVRVHISPLDCLDACGGGVLPATGADIPIFLLIAGGVLVAAGAAALITRAFRRRR